MSIHDTFSTERLLTILEVARAALAGDYERIAEELPVRAHLHGDLADEVLQDLQARLEQYLAESDDPPTPTPAASALALASAIVQQHNLLSTATDEERRQTIDRLIDWWDHVALPVLDPAQTPPAWAAPLIAKLQEQATVRFPAGVQPTTDINAPRYVVVDLNCPYSLKWFGTPRPGEYGIAIEADSEEAHTWGSLDAAAVLVAEYVLRQDRTTETAPVYRLVPVPQEQVAAAVARVQHRVYPECGQEVKAEDFLVGHNRCRDCQQRREERCPACGNPLGPDDQNGRCSYCAPGEE
jgi:hypothetical protein